MNYTKRIIEARKTAGLSQTQVANELMIPQQQYSRYETGDNEIPIRYLIKLCQILKVSSDWILGLTQGEHINPQNLQKYEIRNTITGESASVYFAENINIGEKWQIFYYNKWKGVNKLEKVNIFYEKVINILVWAVDQKFITEEQRDILEENINHAKEEIKD